MMTIAIVVGALVALYSSRAAKQPKPSAAEAMASSEKNQADNQPELDTFTKPPGYSYGFYSVGWPLAAVIATDLLRQRGLATDDISREALLQHAADTWPNFGSYSGPTIEVRLNELLDSRAAATESQRAAQPESVTGTAAGLSLPAEPTRPVSNTGTAANKREPDIDVEVTYKTPEPPPVQPLPTLAGTVVGTTSIPTTQDPVAIGGSPTVLAWRASRLPS